uniref:Uncharacterized protein n=1 Tax=Knipowitschia caucasica TaxID=637954 RepID=A0AAV2LS37_KNICA
MDAFLFKGSSRAERLIVREPESGFWRQFDNDGLNAEVFLKQLLDRAVLLLLLPPSVSEDFSKTPHGTDPDKTTTGLWPGAVRLQTQIDVKD